MGEAVEDALRAARRMSLCSRRELENVGVLP